MSAWSSVVSTGTDSTSWTSPEGEACCAGDVCWRGSGGGGGVGGAGAAQAGGASASARITGPSRIGPALAPPPRHGKARAAALRRGAARVLAHPLADLAEELRFLLGDLGPEVRRVEDLADLQHVAIGGRAARGPLDGLLL